MGQYGIRVNVLTPGITEDTPGAAILYTDEQVRRVSIADIPLGRAGTLTEVKDAAAYLLSDFAGYMTGTNLIIDGGRALGRDRAGVGAAREP